MTSLVQVELQTGNTHTLTWVESSLKPKVGMSMTRKGDPRTWIVVEVYSLIPRSMDFVDKVWKIGVTCVIA